MGKHGYWLCPRPSGDTARQASGMDHADIITGSMRESQWDKLIEKYNARVAAYNAEQRADVDLTHPTVAGAVFAAGGKAASLSTRRWRAVIIFVRGFKWWPGSVFHITDQAIIKRENIQRLDLHWKDGAEDEFYKWLEGPITIEPRKQP